MNGVVMMAAYLMGQALAASGTLAVAMPTQDGLVVAADSRWTYGATSVDVDRSKLHLLPGPPPTVFILTGRHEVLAAPPSSVSIQDWLNSGPREFDGSAVIRASLLSRPSAIDRETLRQAALAFVSSLSRYLAGDPVLVARYRGHELCGLAVFQAAGTSFLIGTATFGLDASGRVQVSSPPTLHVLELDEPANYSTFGAGPYVETHVMRGPGRRFLPHRVTELLDTGKRARELTRDDGWFFATTLIKAAEQTMSIVAPPLGENVGGAVRGYLITPKTAHPLTTP